MKKKIPLVICDMLTGGTELKLQVDKAPLVIGFPRTDVESGL
jgi:hypothetical protein